MDIACAYCGCDHTASKEILVVGHKILLCVYHHKLAVPIMFESDKEFLELREKTLLRLLGAEKEEENEI